MKKGLYTLIQPIKKRKGKKTSFRCHECKMQNPLGVDTTNLPSCHAVHTRRMSAVKMVLAASVIISHFNYILRRSPTLRPLTSAAKAGSHLSKARASPFILYLFRCPPPVFIIFFTILATVLHSHFSFCIRVVKCAFFGFASQFCVSRSTNCKVV